MRLADLHAKILADMKPGEDYYTWLALAVRLLKPKTVLELGTYRGISALAMYSELGPNSTLTTVDVNSAFSDAPADPRLRIVTGNDLDLNTYGATIPKNVDFLFIDTDHNYRQVTAEWNLYKNLLADQALVVLDDIKLNDMPKFWDEVPYEKLDISDPCHPSGFGIFRYDSSLLDHSV